MIPSLPETVMKCCWTPPLGDPCACTTATCAVTCWPFWFWAFEDGSETRICESLESEDSRGTTSMTLTLPEGAVCRIIFFWRENYYAIINARRNYKLSALTWLRFTWCRATGVIWPVRCASDPVQVVFVGEVDGPASESSFDTDVTVMKFLAVASRVAILNAYENYCKLHKSSEKRRPNKTFLAITRTIKSDSLKLLVTNDEKQRFLFLDLQSKSSENAMKGLSIKHKH